MVLADIVWDSSDPHEMSTSDSLKYSFPGSPDPMDWLLPKEIDSPNWKTSY